MSCELERQSRRLVRKAERLERDSKRHLERAQAQLARIREYGPCALCGFKFEAHDEVDGRCPNPDGTL